MLRTHYESRDARMVQLGNLAVVEWRGDVSIEDVGRLEKMIREVADAHDHPVGVLVLIRAATPLPSTEVRKHMQQSLTAVGPRVGLMASVIEGDDVRTFATRATFNAMRAFSRPPHPHRTFARAGDALAWLSAGMAENPESRWTTDQVLRSVA